MFIPSIIFDYPIKRPYPWRFTTVFIFAISILVFSGIIYVNVAVVGLTPSTFSSPTYVKPKDPTWLDRVNIWRTLSLYGCDPTTLATGGQYRTQNGVFTYSIEAASREGGNYIIASRAYKGSVLENCGYDSINARGDFGSAELSTQTYIMCNVSNDFGFDATVSIRKTPTSRKFYQPQNKMAEIAAKVLEDYEDLVLGCLASVQANYGGTSRSCYAATKLSIYEREGVKVTVECADGSQISDEMSSVGIILTDYATIQWSAVLLDLGMNYSRNALTDSTISLEIFQSSVDAYNKLNISSPVAPVTLANLAEMGLPLEQQQPVQLHAQYLCHGMELKNPSNLVIDVLVATISIFMAYWGILNCALQYFAARSSPHGNHCVCPNCNELPQSVSSTFEIHELRSLGRRTGYKAVPTRSQSTPPDFPMLV